MARFFEISCDDAAQSGQLSLRRSNSSLTMDPERWRQVEEVYHAALEREPKARAAFLDTACGSDRQLRREVESLIVHGTWASGQKLKNTSLDDFERLLIGVDNYGWYQAQFVKRAETVYKAQGLAFVEGVNGGVPVRDAAADRARHARATGEDQCRLHRMGRASVPTTEPLAISPACWYRRWVSKHDPKVTRFESENRVRRGHREIGHGSRHSIQTRGRYLQGARLAVPAKTRRVRCATY